MGASRRQLVLIAVLGVVFLGLAIYRLRGSSGGPAPAAAASVPTVAEVIVDHGVDPQAMIDALSMPSDNAIWRLPDQGSLRDRVAGDWPRPRHNPFLISDVLQSVIDGQVGDEDEPAAVSDVPSEAEIAPPPFFVRSTFEVLGSWFAEIGDQAYGVGDVLDGFRIEAIDGRRVRLVHVGTDDGHATSNSTKPTSVILSCGHGAGLVGAAWVRIGDETMGGEVVTVGPDGVVVEPRNDDESTAADGNETIDVPVGRD